MRLLDEAARAVPVATGVLCSTEFPHMDSRNRGVLLYGHTAIAVAVSDGKT
jgi:hypothetical protein